MNLKKRVLILTLLATLVTPAFAMAEEAAVIPSNLTECIWVEWPRQVQYCPPDVVGTVEQKVDYEVQRIENSQPVVLANASAQTAEAGVGGVESYLTTYYRAIHSLVGASTAPLGTSDLDPTYIVASQSGAVPATPGSEDFPGILAPLEIVLGTVWDSVSPGGPTGENDEGSSSFAAGGGPRVLKCRIETVNWKPRRYSLLIGIDIGPIVCQQPTKANIDVRLYRDNWGPGWAFADQEGYGSDTYRYDYAKWTGNLGVPRDGTYRAEAEITLDYVHPDGRHTIGHLFLESPKLLCWTSGSGGCRVK